MPKKLRNNPHSIPAHAINPRVRGGTAFEIKNFPDSRSGVEGPFLLPTSPPAARDFQGWFDYFRLLVGAKLELINAIQFDLDKGAVGPKLTQISDELAFLADQLGMNRPGTTNVPSELTWPLAGSYRIEWSNTEAQSIGFNSLKLHLFFENEPDYRMVVNCSVELDANVPGPSAGNSSSSSYLATSSSSQ